MKWVLTRTCLPAAKGWRHGTCKPEDIRNPVAFRLLDDDGQVYFTGWLEGPELETADGETAFEPLDVFGAAYGCTELQYQENGCWKTL